MNFLADENVDHPVLVRLREDGHRVLAIAEMAPGLLDSDVLASAQEHEALLLTADKDFGDLVYRQQRLASGVVLLRLAGLSQSAKIMSVCNAIRDHGEELLGAFTVISAGIVRIRPRL